MQTDLKLISTESEVNELTTRLAAGATALAIDLETCARDEWRLQDKKAALNPWRGHVSLILIETEGDILVIDVLALEDPRRMLADLGRVVYRRGVIGHNLLFDLPFLAHCLGWATPPPERITDTLVLEAVLTAGAQEKPANPKDADDRVAVSRKLESVVARHLGIRLDKAEQTSDWAKRPLSTAQLTYARNDVRHLRALSESQWSAIRLFGLEAVSKLDLACVPVLVKAMVHGVPLNLKDVDLAARELAGQLIQREQALRQLLEEPRLSLEPADDEDAMLNPRSTPQLKAALTRKLGFQVEETNRAYLILTVRPRSPEVVDALLAWRETASTLQFVRKLRDSRESDGRIHPQFKSETDTGRLSVSRPNMQGLPRGEVVRKCVAAPLRRVFVGADFAQIELRIAGWVYGEQSIKDIYLMEAQMTANGLPPDEISWRCDIHRLAAADLYGKAPKQISKEERSNAKSVSFGVLYGMGPETLAKSSKVKFDVNLEVPEAKRLIQSWLAAKPAIRAIRQQNFTQNKQRRLTECRTVLGRRRILEPGHQASPRYAMNSPIQGACADIMRLTMLKLADRLPASATLVLTVHDEFLIECDETDAEIVKKVLAVAMMDAACEVLPDMPCPVQAKHGYSWASIK